MVHRALNRDLKSYPISRHPGSFLTSTAPTKGISRHPQRKRPPFSGGLVGKLNILTVCEFLRNNSDQLGLVITILNCN